MQRRARSAAAAARVPSTPRPLPLLPLPLLVALIVGGGAALAAAARPPTLPSSLRDSPTAAAAADLINTKPPAERHNALELVNAEAIRSDPDPSVSLRVDGGAGGSVLKDGRGQWVTVSWSGVPAPDYGDWIALFPAAALEGGDGGGGAARLAAAVAPIKYQLAARACSHLATGSGKLKFRLISYRQNVRFAFMRGGLLAPRAAALSGNVTVARPNEPLQARLALSGGGPTEMLVQWSSRDAQNPVVQYGEDKGKLDRTAVGCSHTYE